MFITPVGGATASRHCEKNTHKVSWQYEWSNSDIYCHLLRGICIRKCSFWKMVSYTKIWFDVVREDSSEDNLHQFCWRMEKRRANKSKKKQTKNSKSIKNLQNGLKNRKSQYSAGLQKYTKWASYAKFVQIDLAYFSLFVVWLLCHLLQRYRLTLDLVWYHLGLIWWFMTYFIWSKFREGPKRTVRHKRKTFFKEI